MQKHKFGVTCPDAFCGVRTGPTRTRKIVHQSSMPRMHWNALHDPQIPGIQKHKFGAMSLVALLMLTAPGPTEHEK
jgi:hypothetical protein